MVNHLLAGIVGIGSLSLFLSGFFFPEVRRKPDLAWSGIGLIYALVLWIEGDRTPGGALFGHIVSVSLIVWFGWQTLQQRWQFASPDQQTAIPQSLETLTPFLKAGWGQIAVAYGEASGWVKDQLRKDDTITLSDTLTQPPLENEDDWDAGPSIDLEPVALDTAAASETPIAELTEIDPSQERLTQEPTIVPEHHESDLVSPIVEAISEPSPSIEAESIFDPSQVSETEDLQTAIADNPPVPGEAPIVNAEEPPELSSKAEQNANDILDREALSPANNSDSVSFTEPSAASGHPEEDESWPPPDPVT